MQLVAPSLAPVLVTEPAVQTVQAVTFEKSEYRPAAHKVHRVPPLAGPVLVMLPAAQAMQSSGLLIPRESWCLPGAQSVHVATLDWVEYLP